LVTKSQVKFAIKKGMLTRRGTLYKKFLGELAKSTFSQIHKSYIERSLGRTDIYGQKWVKLEPYTIKKKENLKLRGKLGPGVSPNRRMIETRRSERSLRPGRAVWKGYVPANEDQYFALKGTTVKFGSKVKHLKWAEQAGKGRKILDRKSSKLIIKKAIDISLRKTTQYIEARYKK
jgi:hypothetical protein